MDEQNMDILRALFHKVARGEQLDAGEQRLLDKLSERTEWREVRDNLSNGEYLNKRLEDMKRYPKKEAFAKFSKRVYSPVRKRFILRISVAAASIMFILGWVLFGLMKQDERSVEPIASNIIPAGTFKASLVLATGEVIGISSEIQNIKIGESSQLENRDGELVYKEIGEADVKQYNELIVPRGGEYAIVLSDGTKVKLNADSRLRYPVKFSSKERCVEVLGEAFFEVAKNGKKPFIVKCGEVRMKVLGTSFNVNGYERENSIVTTLVEGKLEVSTGRQRVVLRPGLQSHVDNYSGNIDTLSVDVDNYIAWLNNKFTFKDESLVSIMKALSRWYDVTFVFDGINPEDYCLTGKIPRHGTLQEVTMLLEQISDVSFDIEGRKVFVRKNK